MRKRVYKILDLPSNGAFAALIIMSVVFLIGSLAGCTFVRRADGAGEAALYSYLDGYLKVAASNEIAKPDFLSVLWKGIRWTVVALCFGLTPIGLIGIPVLFLSRAFLLSFSIASFFHVFGAKGLIFSFTLFGAAGLIYIPVLFILGIQSFLNAGMITGRLTGESRRSLKPGRVEILRCCICFAALFVCCFVEYSFGPTVFKSVAELLLGLR